MFDLERYKENIAVVTDDMQLNYSQLNEEVNRVIPLVDKHKLVFCLCENRLGSLLGYIAFINASAPTVLLDGTKDKSTLESLLQIYNPAYIWCPAERNDIIGNLPVIYYSHGFKLLSYNQSADTIDSNVSLLLTTSGSTGSPKLVRLSYANVLSNAESIAEYLNITSAERPITSLPMYYSYGLSVINSHLIKGATILLTDQSVIQKEFWSFAKEQKATSIAGVPYTYEMLKRLRIFRMDLPYLRTMTQAGGKLNANIAKEYMEQAEATGRCFIVMYGQTEATARMSYLPWDKALEKYSSIGIAIPGGQFSLIDENGNEIAGSGIDGELVYTGPNVSLGYAECLEDLAKGDENHGILHTGDIACRDEDGYYYITGRMKRYLKIYGNRVNLDATEQLVKAVITSCACVGVDDKLTVFITEAGREEEIRSLLVKKTGLNARAFTVRVITSLPKNTSGKIQYTELSRLLEN